jgi:hypothetical protein
MRLIMHARYYWLMRAVSHLTRRLLGNMVRRINALPRPARSWRSEWNDEMMP